MSSLSNIYFSCIYCRKNLSVPASLAGITGPCPNCGNSITAPSLPQQAPLPQQYPPQKTSPEAQAISAPRVNPAPSELPKVEPRKTPLMRGNSLIQLPQMPVSRDVSHELAHDEPEIEPTPAIHSHKVDPSDTSTPHYSTFTESHAIPIEQIQRPSSRKKKKPLTSQTKFMLIACFAAIAFILAVTKELKNRKSGKSNGNAARTANVTNEPSKIKLTNETVEDALDGNHDQNHSAAVVEAEDDSSNSNIPDTDVIKTPELQSAKNTKMVAQFLKAKDYSERRSFVRTRISEEDILNSFANKKWPLSEASLEPIDINPAENKITYRFHVNFGINGYGFPEDVLIMVNQLGSNPAKIELDPLFDTIGGRLRQFAESPYSTDTKTYGIEGDRSEAMFLNHSSLKESQDFYCVVNAREKSYEATAPIPNIDKKCTFNLRAYTDGKEIAVAYAKEKSKVREAFANQFNGLGWNKSRPMRLTLKWNVEEDPEKPYIEVIAIKSIDWND